MSLDPLWQDVTFLVANDNAAAGLDIFPDQSQRRVNTLSEGNRHNSAVPKRIAIPEPVPAGEMQTVANFTPGPEADSTGHIRTEGNIGDALDFGSGDFCIEGFFRPVGNPYTVDRTFTLLTDGNIFRIQAVPGTTNTKPGNGKIHNFRVSLTSLGIINAEFAGLYYMTGPQWDVWHHVAFYRIGNSFYAAVNGGDTAIGGGALVGTSSGAVPPFTAFYVGDDGAAFGNGFVGQACSIRVTKGHARYPAEHPFPVPELPFHTLGIAPPTVVCQVDGQIEEPFEYMIAAVGEEPPFVFSVDTLPPGLSLDPVTGRIFGTPTEEGTFTLRANASNVAGQNVCAATIVIIIHPTPPPPAPVITSELEITREQGAPFDYTITATGEEPITFGAVSLLPGLELDPETGEITGETPADVGVYHTEISATDVHGQTTTETLTINLELARPPTGAPIITSDDTASGVVGNPFTYVITARNGPTSFWAIGLPDGLAVNTQTGTIAGSPREMGTFHVTLQASNYAGTGQMMLTLSIAPAPVDQPCPPPPHTKSLSGPDVPAIQCYIPDGCCGPSPCDIDEATFICQVRSLLPEGDPYNNTAEPIAIPAPQYGAITVGCARVGCEQLVLGGCCGQEVIPCEMDPAAPQLAVVDSFGAAVYAVVQSLCKMLLELDPCTAHVLFKEWARRMGITHPNPCGPGWSDRILVFLICFLTQLRNNPRAVNWEFLVVVANRMSANITMRYAGDMNGTANTEEPYLSGWWTMARDAPVCPPREPCPPDPRAELGGELDQARGGQALEPVACAPPNENSPLSLNIIVCPSDVYIPDNCNLPTVQSPQPFDRELYEAFWWLLPQLLPRGPLWCIYECCEADCIV